MQAILLRVRKIQSIAETKNGLQCYLTIPRRIAILHDNRIDFNKNKYVFKDLTEVLSSDDWSPYEYIDDEVNKKLDKTKGQIAGDEMEKETKQYMESLNHDPNWLKTITNEIDEFLINSEYINFFIIMFMQCSKDNVSI